MNKILPDKWVRKAIFDRINNIVVDDITIPCYDFIVPNSENTTAYCLISTQTNSELKANKCESSWQSSVLIDVFTRFNSSGNYASRLLADNIADEVRSKLELFSLDAESGLTIVLKTDYFENDIITQTDNEIVFRKLYRLELYIN